LVLKVGLTELVCRKLIILPALAASVFALTSYADQSKQPAPCNPGVEANDLFDKADQNGDGAITKAEFEESAIRSA
jgi:hypothetical protein